MKVYLVGGAVRDELMGFPSNDNDYVVVGATEDELLGLGYNKVGADFPVFLDDAGDQYALARKERKTGRGYLGFETTFDPSVTLEDDLFRRDLTINAIAKDVETGEIVDPFGGAKDLEQRILRHVSAAFQEDPLRVVRLARFFARWNNFKIAPETVELARELVKSGELNDLADERFYAELEKTFIQSREPARFFQALELFDALNNVHFFKDVFGETHPSHVMNKVANAVKILPAELQLPGFLAIVGRGPMNSNGVPAYVKKLSQAYQKAASVQGTAEGALELLLSVRGFDSTSKLLDDLVLIMGVSERVGLPLPLVSSLLKSGASSARKVSAENFLHLKGKAIGDALNAERLAQLRTVFR